MAHDSPDGRQPQHRDWFIAAIETDGSVLDCLDSVHRELEAKMAFVGALRLRLREEGPLDPISSLAQRIRSLENTLRFRLGILRPERPSAWFRAPAATTVGPFSSPLVAEPVLARYDAGDVDLVRQGLLDAWQNKIAKPLPFRDGSSCLWRMTLELNAQLETLDVFPKPLNSMRFSELPQGLDPKIESRSLRAFLINVRTEICACRTRLDECYDLLLKESEKLWKFQKAAMQDEGLRSCRRFADDPRTGRGAQARASGTRSSFGAGSADSRQEKSHGAWGRHRAADDVRQEFAKRRRRSAALKTPKDLEALRYMGFNDYPSSEGLRHRYLHLAKKMHPDANKGCDDAFKMLTRAYSHLSARVGK